MAGLLGQVFSAGNVARRKLTDLLGNPVLSAQQIVGNLNDRARVLNEMTSAAAQEGVNYGPASRQLAGLLAEAYSPVGMVAPRSEALKIAQKNAAKSIKEGGLGLPPDNTPMDRAKAMGFDVDTTMYHATDKDFSAFIPSTKGKLGAGVYLSPSSRYAEKYVGDEARVLPVLSRGKFADDAQRTEIADAVREEMMKSNPNFSVQDWKRNIDKAMQDLGFDGTEMYMERTVYDPSLIRSRFAAFDPARIKENDLLAGVLPLSLLADEEQRKKADAYFRSLLGQ